MMKGTLPVRCAALILAFCLCLCACESSPSTQSEAASSVLAASSGTTSSQEGKLPEYDEAGWAIVENIRLNLGLGVMDDHTRCFPEDAKGYIVEGSSRPYQLDADALRRVVASPCKGRGSLLWRDFNAYAGNGNPEQFDGVIPVSKLNDPIFLSMCMPSEGVTVRAERVNAQNMAYYPADANRVLAIGAIYPNTKAEIDDSETFTICLGRISLVAKDEDGWFLGDDRPFPTSPDRLYYLPWELERKLGVAVVPAERVLKTDDHVEVTLTGADFNGGDGRAKGADGACLHFWGSFVHISGPEAKGIVSAYRVWVKEEAAVGKLVATVAADWYTPAGKIMQAYVGYNRLVRTEPQTLIGHTVGPARYDEVMDTATVQKLLGLH